MLEIEEDFKQEKEVITKEMRELFPLVEKFKSKYYLA